MESLTKYFRMSKGAIAYLEEVAKDDSLNIDPNRFIAQASVEASSRGKRRISKVHFIDLVKHVNYKRELKNTLK